jgi:hypothetical protein
VSRFHAVEELRADCPVKRHEGLGLTEPDTRDFDHLQAHMLLLQLLEKFNEQDVPFV